MIMLISLENISKTYKSQKETIKVLDSIDLKISEGSISTIFGHSGVGKSTLLSIICGILRPDNGKIKIDNNMLTPENAHLIRKEKFGILLQDSNLLNEFTVKENLLLPQIINNVKYKDAIDRIENLVSFLNMSDYLARYPSEISRGEYQRISLLRSLSNSPKIIIADEPTANLDENNCKQLLNLVVKLNKELDITFIIATHDSRFLKISNKIFKLFNGKIIQNE